MAGRRNGTGSTTACLIAAAAIAMAGLVTGCSSSKATSAPPTTLNPALVKRGITLTLEPSGHPKALKIPAAFLACTAAKIPAAARPTVAAVTNGDKVPGNVEVYVAKAGAACNRPLLTASLSRSLTDTSSGLHVSAQAASCASRKAVVSLLRLDPAKVAANTGNNAANRAIASSLDGCAPFAAFVASVLHQGDPTITSTQLSCMESKMTTKSWTAMMASDAAFKADLQRAAHACGLG